MVFRKGNLWTLARNVATLAALVAAASCGDSGTSPSTHTIADFITSISANNGAITAVQHDEAPPSAGSGPTVTVTGAGTVITGGSATVGLTGSASFSSVIVAIEGVSGYYEINLPSAVSTATLLMTLNQTIPDSLFNLDYGVGTGGSVGSYQSTPVNVIQVGSGDVQVSVSWHVPSDVDLHVVDPNGDEVYYGNTEVASGGKLDLDSNAACDIDNVDNENITWANAPSGTYTVRVDYWDACGQSQSDYVVTVQRKGHAPQTFTGTLTGTGDNGGEGSGTQITTFTFP